MKTADLYFVTHATLDGELVHAFSPRLDPEPLIAWIESNGGKVVRVIRVRGEDVIEAREGRAEDWKGGVMADTLLRLDDLSGWFGTYWNRPEASRCGCGTDVDLDYWEDERVLWVGLDDDDSRLSAQVPLAVIANLLRLAGWTVTPPETRRPREGDADAK